MSHRYAIYYAPPPGSGLEAFGRQWLGRDHVTDRTIQQPKIDSLDSAFLSRITRSAGHYGFHATLKAPFVLRDGKNADELIAKASAFAASRTAFEIPGLIVARLSQWVAFTLKAPAIDMDRLAADCVRAFEPLRAEPDQADLDRRRQAGLTPRQNQQLVDYGYPYIFEDFHFHMTLAGPLDGDEAGSVHQLLAGMAPPGIGEPLTIDAISIYEQPSRDQPFIQTARLPFQAP